MSTTVDMTGFTQRMNQLQGFGMSGGRILRVESKRLLQSVMSQTHPKKAAQGVSAVKRDLLKVFFPVADRIASGATPMTGANSGFVKLWVEDDGKKVVAVKTSNFKPNASVESLVAIHKATRGADGRVGGTGLIVRREVRGKLNSINRVVVRQGVFDAYEKAVTAHVGKLRSGFARALIALGGNVPNWVKRHADGTSGVTGFVRDDLGPGPKPSITIGNTAAGAEPRLGGIVKRALAGRTKAIATNIRRMIKHGAGKSGDYGYAA